MPRTCFLQAVLTALAGLALFAARPAHAQLSFHYEELLPPMTDPTLGSYAASISANGTIVGAYADTNQFAHGYIRSSTGTYTTFDYPYGIPGTGFLPGTYLIGVNNAGDITGNYGDLYTNTTDFIYHNGSFLTPTVAGAAYTFFNPVNEAGLVPTVYTDAIGHSHSAIYNIAAGAFTLVPDVSGYTDSFIQTILPDGTVVSNVGNIDLTTGDGYFQGSLTLGGVTTLFNAPGAVDTRLDDVTSTGMYVGHYFDANQIGHGFVYDSIGKNFYTIDVPGATETDLRTGNSANQFVGDYFDANGAQHSLLVTAVPEPGSVALLVGLGVTGAGFLRRKTRKVRAC